METVFVYVSDISNACECILEIVEIAQIINITICIWTFSIILNLLSDHKKNNVTSLKILVLKISIWKKGCIHVGNCSIVCDLDADAIL